MGRIGFGYTNLLFLFLLLSLFLFLFVAARILIRTVFRLLRCSWLRIIRCFPLTGIRFQKYDKRKHDYDCHDCHNGNQGYQRHIRLAKPSLLPRFYIRCGNLAQLFRLCNILFNFLMVDLCRSRKGHGIVINILPQFVLDILKIQSEHITIGLYKEAQIRQIIMKKADVSFLQRFYMFLSQACLITHLFDGQAQL